MCFECTRVFGLVRRLCLGMAEDLLAAGRLRDRSEVFYLCIEELLGLAEAGELSGDLSALVDLRRAEYQACCEEPDLPRRFITRGAGALGAIEPAAEVPDERRFDPERRSGTGCAAGRVRGRAAVVRDPKTARVEPGDILIASFTAPGWVTLFVAAAGLVRKLQSS